MVGENPELIDVYLAGVSTEQLLKEVSCGETNVQGVKIIVPPERYDVVISRLEQFVCPSGRWSNPVEAFLGNRCSSDFLAMYYEKNESDAYLPKSIWVISPYDNSLKILNKLQKFGLLKEEVRAESAKKIIIDCENKYACCLLDEPFVEGLLTAREKNEAISRITGDVIENGEYIIKQLRDDWDEEDDPFLIFYDIMKTIDFIENDDMFSEEQIRSAKDLLIEIGLLSSEMEARLAECSYESLEAEQAIEIESVSTRNIFDDVDE